jgi:hypothetical protein
MSSPLTTWSSREVSLLGVADGLDRKLPRDELVTSNLELKVSIFFLGQKLPRGELAARKLEFKVGLIYLEC